MNVHFRQRCEAERVRTVQSLFGPFVIGTRFAEEQIAAVRLPEHRFDPCVIRPAAPVDKYQTVAFDRNRYSVPRQTATLAQSGHFENRGGSRLGAQGGSRLGAQFQPVRIRLEEPNYDVTDKSPEW